MKFTFKKVSVILLICVLFSGCSKEKKKELTASDITTQLNKSITTIDNIIVYTEKTDTNNLLGRPNQYTSKTNFADTSIEQPEDIGDPNGGTVEVFNNSSDAQDRYDYIKKVTKGTSALQQYMYIYDNVLLRLSYDLTPKQAQSYDGAMIEITK